LVIFRDVGESVDPLLIDRHPLRRAERLTHPPLQVLHGYFRPHVRLPFAADTVSLSSAPRKVTLRFAAPRGAIQKGSGPFFPQPPVAQKMGSDPFSRVPPVDTLGPGWKRPRRVVDNGPRAPNSSLIEKRALPPFPASLPNGRYKCPLHQGSVS